MCAHSPPFGPNFVAPFGPIRRAAQRSAAGGVRVGRSVTIVSRHAFLFNVSGICGPGRRPIAGKLHTRDTRMSGRSPPHTPHPTPSVAHISQGNPKRTSPKALRTHPPASPPTYQRLPHHLHHVSAASSPRLCPLRHVCRDANTMRPGVQGHSQSPGRPPERPPPPKCWGGGITGIPPPTCCPSALSSPRWWPFWHVSRDAQMLRAGLHGQYQSPGRAAMAGVPRTMDRVDESRSERSRSGEQIQKSAPAESLASEAAGSAEFWGRGASSMRWWCAVFLGGAAGQAAATLPHQQSPAPPRRAATARRRQ